MDDQVIGELNPDGTAKRTPSVCAASGRTLTKGMPYQTVKLGGGYFVRSLYDLTPAQLDSLRDQIKPSRKVAVKEES